VSVKSIEELRKLPITQVISISGHHSEKLKTLKNYIVELKDMKFNPKMEFIKAVDLKEKTKLLIINKHASTIESFNEKRKFLSACLIKQTR